MVEKWLQVTSNIVLSGFKPKDEAARPTIAGEIH
jgi:hypothetical protein